MRMATPATSDLMMAENMMLRVSWLTTLGLFLTVRFCQQNMIATSMLSVLSHWAHFGMDALNIFACMTLSNSNCIQVCIQIHTKGL